MGDRTLSRADDKGKNPNGYWTEVRLVRSSAGAPGLQVVITDYLGDDEIGDSSIMIEDGAAFLAPANDWLSR